MAALTVTGTVHDCTTCFHVPCTCRERSRNSSNLAVCLDAFVVPRYSPSFCSLFFTYSIVRRMVQAYCTILRIRDSIFVRSVTKNIRCSLVADEFVRNDIRPLLLLSWFQPSLPLPLVDGKRLMCFLEHIIAFLQQNCHNSVVVNEFSLICWCVSRVSYILY